jgi:hypothetical protein
LRIVPRLDELSLFRRSPLFNEPSSVAGQLPCENAPRIDIYRRKKLPVFRMKMGRIMVVVVEANYDSEKEG